MNFKKLSSVLSFDAPDSMISSIVDQHFNTVRCKCGEKKILICSADVSSMRRNVSAFCPKCKDAEKVGYSEKTGKQTHIYVKEQATPPPPKPAKPAKPIVGESRWADI